MSTVADDTRCRNPAESVVYDAPSRCPYRPDQIARLPLRLPARTLSHAELGRRLHAGDRRQGRLLYRPMCPGCQACEAIRIDVPAFAANRTQRRVMRRGGIVLRTEVARPRLTRDRVLLYNRHKIGRGLVVGGDLLDADGYREFLVESCADTFELTYRCAGELAGVALLDRAADGLSAVYCYFDPAYARLSPGVFSILREIELCRAWNLRYLYLGLYVVGCAAMAYKARYLPHERLVDGQWRRFARPCDSDD